MYPEAMKATFQIENPTYHSKVRPALHLGSIISFLLVYQCDCNSLCCVIPENNPSPPQKGWEIPCGTGVSKTEKKKEENKRKQCMKENWNFHRGGGFTEQTPYMGRATHFILV